MLVVRGGDGGSGTGGGGAALVEVRIETDRLRIAVADPAAGAAVLFIGTARGVTDGAVTRSLEYEAHGPLAEESLARLCADAVVRFGLIACAVEHRLGRVAVGEAAVALATSAPHRAAAFAAAEWLMERIKADVPIWKREEWEDGRREWVHPGGEPGGIVECSQ
ncbi:MAG: molybdenum cofactor biosynthesis protein MoaE [Planctomycetaceae bacterium]